MLKLMMMSAVLMSLSLSSFSKVNYVTKTLNDQYREELRDMAMQNHRPLTNYRNSRKLIMQKVHLKSDSKGYFVKDVYCNIKFRGSISPSDMPSANKINIEHTWPRSRFSSSKGSTKYKQELADLHHLYPTESRSNSVRGNHEFTQFKTGGAAVGKNCISSKVGRSPQTGARSFEPPFEHKGDVARALFYMAVRYNERISSHEEFVLRQWHIMDPVDQKEIDRNDRVEQLQGNRNPFVDDQDLVNLIQNF